MGNGRAGWKSLRATGAKEGTELSRGCPSKETLSPRDWWGQAGLSLPGAPALCTDPGTLPRRDTRDRQGDSQLQDTSGASPTLGRI